ncbi:MAG: hypothetical protein NTV34_04645 [Proteobacteria bacterium]|nr:hypothetical protein [Pseudomonadota bacterium]
MKFSCRMTNTKSSGDLLSERVSAPFFGDLTSEKFSTLTHTPPNFTIECPIKDLMDDSGFNAERRAFLVFPSGIRVGVI